MGCTSSSAKPRGLSPQDLAERIEKPVATMQVDLGRTRIRYAYLSQRGYYPDTPNKPNQDAYYVKVGLDNTSGDTAFFGVYDGHGPAGDACAIFTRESLCENLEACLGEGLSLERALERAYKNTNTAMHEAESIQDDLSGTTAITLTFKDDVMYTANVGDSRAIIVQQRGGPDGELTAKHLSYDQTPYRKDERERVRRSGARVLSLDQLEGLVPPDEGVWDDIQLGSTIDLGGDPPRIWDPEGEWPGTAFTRSIGDAVAEELGVFAEPEISKRSMAPYDRFIVLASDGVFEFLTNKAVCDIVARCDDPLAACEAVVQEAYQHWLSFETRTDDITIICIFTEVEDRPPPGAARKRGPRFSTAVDNAKLSGLRPVRREASRDSRRRTRGSRGGDGEGGGGSPGGSPRGSSPG